MFVVQDMNSPYCVLYIFVNATYESLVVDLVNNVDDFLYSPHMLACLLNDRLNTLRRN